MRRGDHHSIPVQFYPFMCLPLKMGIIFIWKRFSFFPDEERRGLLRLKCGSTGDRWCKSEGTAPKRAERFLKLEENGNLECGIKWKSKNEGLL